MNRYLVVTLIAVVAIFLSRAEKFKIFGPDTITEERLAKILENTDQRVVLYFWQPNSPPCDATIPLLEEVIGEYSKKLVLVKIDTSNADNRPVHDAYSINATPTIVIVQKGKLLSQWVGPFKDKKQLITFLKPSGSY